MNIQKGLPALLCMLVLASKADAQAVSFGNIPLSASQFNVCVSEPSPNTATGSECLPFAKIDRSTHVVTMLPAFAQGVVSAVGLSGNAADLNGSFAPSRLPVLAATGGTIDGATIGASNPSSASFTNATALGLTAREFQGGSLGSTWTTQYHANWNEVQSQVPNNPTEWQIYSNAANGIAQVVSGTNQVVGTSGSAFSASWVGHPYFYFEGVAYTVASVSDPTHMTVQTTAGGSVSWPSTTLGTFYYATTTTTATCNVSGNAVTYVSGQRFIPFFDALFVNGTQYAATYSDTSHMTLTGASLSVSGATCQEFVNINNELSNIRLQGLYGSNEENFVITETPAAAVMQTTYAGQGKYRPILIKNGEQPAGTATTMMGFYPNATLGGLPYITIGGGTDFNNEAVAIAPNSNNRNFVLMQGGGTGFGASIASRGTDANPGLGIDTQGTGSVAFSSGAFGFTEFKVFAGAAANFLAVASDASSPTLSANGSSSLVNIKLAPKGGGNVISTGPVQLAAYTVATLPACSTQTANTIAAVTDGTAPTYGTAPTGGSNRHFPVFCDGGSWTAH